MGTNPVIPTETRRAGRQAGLFVSIGMSVVLRIAGGERLGRLARREDVHRAGLAHYRLLERSGDRGVSVISRSSLASASASSRADADPSPIEADDVAELQLSSAAAINLTVHEYIAIDDGRLHVSAGVEEPGELQELPETNPPTADRDVVNGSRLHHPRMLADR